MPGNNGVALKIAIAVLAAVIVGFLSGRYSGPGEVNSKAIASNEVRIRIIEVQMSQIQNDVTWIKKALAKEGYAP